MLNRGEIALRPPCDADVPQLARIRNDVETQRALLARPRPSDAHRVRAWIRKRLDAPDGLFFVIARRASDEALGFIELRRLQPHDGTAWFGVALAPDARGQGVAAEAWLALAAFATDVHGVRKVCLEVRSDNQPAIRLYQRLGFRIVGEWQDHVREGSGFVNVTLMEILL